MATKSAGRVSIRVLPDSSRFREDLKKSLERIEKTTKATIPAHLEVTRESVRRLREQLRDLEVRIKVLPYVTQQQLHDLKENIEENVDPRLRVDLDALNAQRRLATISRTRTVSLIVRVNQASVAAAMSTLAALSGARILSNTFEPLFNRIKELDKIAPKVGFISSGIAGLSAILLTAVSNAAGLAGSLAALGQSAVLIPALMTSAGISIATLIVVLKDMKTVLKDLGPQFTELQDVMSSEFWNIAADPIREMVNTLMPSLREQLINTSQVWGVVFREIADGLRETLTADKLNFAFDNMNQSIARAAGAVKPLIRAFTTLGLFGTQYLPRLSSWLVDLSKKFDNFIARADKSGDLEKWAERGIEEFKALGRVIFETGRVFGALNRAAQAAGGATFSTLADGLRKLADVMNTSNFQTTFATIFAGAHTAMDGLIRGLGELGNGLASFAPTLAIVFKEVGLILEGVGRALRNLFSNPELQVGIQNFFSGFKTFIDTLGPGMAPLGRIIGTLATAMGNLLAQAGPLISQALILLAPLFEEIWEAIRPLIPDLFRLAMELLPVFAEVVREAVPVVRELVPIVRELAPVFSALVKAMAPVIIQFLRDFTQLLKDGQPYIQGAAQWFTDIANALNLFPLAMFQFFTNNPDWIKNMFQIAIDHPEIPAFFNVLNTALGGLFDKILASANTVQIISGLAGAFNVLSSDKVLGALVTGIGKVLALWPQWQAFWQNAGTVVQLFITAVQLALSIGFPQFTTQFTLWTNGTTPLWANFWRGLAPVVTTYLALARNGTSGGLAGIAATFGIWFATQAPRFTTFFSLVRTIFTIGMSGLSLAVTGGIPRIIAGFIGMNAQTMAEIQRGFGALPGIVSMWMGRIAAAITIGGSLAISNMTGIPRQMVANLFGMVGEFFSAGSSLITAFAQGISSGQNFAVSAAIAVVKAALSVLPKSPAKRGPLSGQGWINLKKSGTTVTKQWASGLTADLSSVHDQSGRVVSALRFDKTGASASSVVSAASTSLDRSRAMINIEGDYYGATPEKVAKDFDTRLRRNSLATQLGKIGIG